jgi:hypothetical protein
MSGTPELADQADIKRLSERTGIPIGATRDHPCATCPYRLCNAGKESAYAPADALNATWQGHDGMNISVRDGSTMLCHAANDAKSATNRYATVRWLETMSEYRQCAGALVVQQREALRYHEHGSGVVADEPSRGARRAQLRGLARDAGRAFLASESTEQGFRDEVARLTRWASEAPPRMTAAGIKRVAERLLRRSMTLTEFRRLPRDTVLKAAHPALNDPAIGHLDLEPPRPGEFET